MRVARSAFLVMAALAAAMGSVGTAVAAQQINGGATAYTMPNETRLVTFNFDQNRTYTILTRPGAITDIQLGHDEKLVAFALGDTVQWVYAKAPGHIFIKPVRKGLFTSATIVTNKRTYELTLRSSPVNGAWYQAVTWHYPMMVMLAQQQAAQAKTKADQQQKHLQAQTIGTIPNIDSLNFGYSIDGSADFKPKQVFDDGKFTWIRMSSKLQSLPALFLVNAAGNYALTNYVVKGQYLVVQRLFHTAVLKMNDQKITITNNHWPTHHEARQYRPHGKGDMGSFYGN